MKNKSKDNMFIFIFFLCFSFLGALFCKAMITEFIDNGAQSQDILQVIVAPVMILIGLYCMVTFAKDVYWENQVIKHGINVEAVVKNVTETGRRKNDRPYFFITAKYGEIYFKHTGSYDEVMELKTHVKVRYLEKDSTKYEFMLEEPVSSQEYFFARHVEADLQDTNFKNLDSLIKKIDNKTALSFFIAFFGLGLLTFTVVVYDDLSTSTFDKDRLLGLLFSLFIMAVSLPWAKCFFDGIYWDKQVMERGINVKADVISVIAHPNLSTGKKGNKMPVPVIIAKHEDMYFTRCSDKYEIRKLRKIVWVRYIKENVSKHIIMLNEPVGGSEYFFESEEEINF